jgi:hypothetical protein
MFDAETIENILVGKAISDLLDEGFQAHVEYREDGYTWVYASEDGRMPRGGYTHWIKFRTGNGADALVDYTTNLEDVLKPVNALAASMMK